VKTMSELYDIFKSSEEINETINSEQFPYSEKIQEYRTNSKLDFFDFAKKLNLSPNEYLDYEYCDLNIPVEKYKKLIKKIESEIKK
jgi:hypothetical protein